ncbi:MAG: 50S ribosomal protein L6 [Candidatus Portnoybacteria bacterium]|nr:50S ribosomal protein L6 [Candidatus Portnoybacteria bacterium]
MSRIGKLPIDIPEKVSVSIEGDFIVAKGPKGELKTEFKKFFVVELKDNKVFVTLKNKEDLADKKKMALWGLIRSLAANMIRGVNEGYKKVLEVEGIGYRVSLQGKKLVMSLGFSHPVEVEPPQGIEFKTEKNTITVSGIDKGLVGQVAANIRSLKKPEPYKGKGIRYQGEVIKIKAGKKAAATEM